MPPCSRSVALLERTFPVALLERTFGCEYDTTAVEDVWRKQLL